LGTFFVVDDADEDFWTPDELSDNDGAVVGDVIAVVVVAQSLLSDNII